MWSTSICTLFCLVFLTFLLQSQAFSITNYGSDSIHPRDTTSVVDVLAFVIS